MSVQLFTNIYKMQWKMVILGICLVLAVSAIFYNGYTDIGVPLTLSSTVNIMPLIPQLEKKEVEIKPIHRQENANKVEVIARFDGPTNMVEHHINCPEYRCWVTSNCSSDQCEADFVWFTTPAVHVHALDPPQKNPRALWAFFSQEAPTKLRRTPEQVAKWNGLFNYSITFSRKSEGNQYVFRYEFKKKKHAHTQHFTPRPGMLPLRVLLFTSHCSTNNKKPDIVRGREYYVRELSKHVHIDVYTSSEKGDCERTLVGLIRNKTNGFEPKMTDYMFYLSFENSLCQDYISEKFWKILNSHSTTIPIALGGQAIEDYEIVAPPNSFLHVRNFTSPEALANHLKFIAQDGNAFHYYNQWRNEYELIGHHKTVGFKQTGDVLRYLCKLAHERPQRIWETFNKDYSIHQCVDAIEPEAFCPYYNLTCS